MAGNRWSSGLCDCFYDWKCCCLTCCCPCVTFGRNAELVDRGQSTCCAKGCVFYCLSLLPHQAVIVSLISFANPVPYAKSIVS